MHQGGGKVKKIKSWENFLDVFGVFLIQKVFSGLASELSQRFFGNRQNQNSRQRSFEAKSIRTFLADFKGWKEVVLVQI